MQIGMVGLGKMGGNMAERLRRGGHEVVGYDHDPEVSDVGSLKELAERLQAPRAVWVMVPAGKPTQQTIDRLGELLSEGDVVVDGAAELVGKGIRFVDCGVSGGVWGLENGYALMVGGEQADVQHLMPIFETLKPEGEDGFVHAGDVGAGHFAKMVHNGIEYGMMQAFAEGWELLEASDVVKDVRGSFSSWRTGTVIRSWLLDLLVRALDDDEKLAELRGYAQDSGEGRWTVQAAVDHAVPLPVITAALYARFASRQDDPPAMKVVAALRNQFGGHATTSAEGSVEKGADAPGADVRPPREAE
jgi:6-phosphogluconate dehydrogenase